MAKEKKCRISFVIPVRDEEGTLRDLATRVIKEVESDRRQFSVEVIFVDDGSIDGSWDIIGALVSEFRGVVVGVRLRRNFGKATALEAGFRQSRGEIVFTMDADLQDDPSEIPRFLTALEEGYDLVSGWKARRYDPVTKTVPSRIFNIVTAWATGVSLHDFNCGFKCYRRELIDSIRIYGELHRYIPVLAHDAGFRVGEIEVQHHPRKSGVSKYGWERYMRGLVDLITVLATTRWLSKPGHLFGGIGLVFGFIGGGSLIYLVVLWFAGYGPIGGRPLLLFGVLFCICSVQMISLGVIAEFFIRAQNPREISGLITEIRGGGGRDVTRIE